MEQQRRGRRSGKPRCSFRDSDRDDRERIFGGSKIAICDRCVERCVEEIAAS